jgi:hypothetical protein
MPDYQKGKIYRIISPSKNLVYYGSTIQSISRRLASHLRDYKKYNENNINDNITSFLVLECQDYKIELVEEYPCNNKQQLEKKEGEYIKNNECVNKCVAGRTRKEYRLDNIDKYKEYAKQYRIDNFDKKKEYYKQWTINNPDKMKQYENTDKRKEYKKQYNKQYRLKKKLDSISQI